MAAALELEYLAPRRGRGASTPWSPDRADSELALVQFTAHAVDTSKQYGVGSMKQLKPRVASRSVQLQQLSDLRSVAVAGRGRSAVSRHHRRTDHDRIELSAGEVSHLLFGNTQ